MRARLKFMRPAPISNSEFRIQNSELRTTGFSVIEMLVAVSIMTVIVFALYSIFNRTQLAMRGSMTQADISETGRATMDLIARDVEKLAPTRMDGVTNFLRRNSASPQFLSQIDPAGTNILWFCRQESFYVLSRQGDSWVGTGYRIAVPPLESGSFFRPGTLVRFSVQTNAQFLTPYNLTDRLNAALALTNSGVAVPSLEIAPVADGVVHLQFTPLDAQGRPFVSLAPWPFVGNSVPAYVEIELGVLEGQALAKYQALGEGGPGPAQDFLRKQSNKIQMFRKRIPIRSAPL